MLVTPVQACAWMACGCVLLFAIGGHPSFLNLQIAGLILLIRGATGLWLGIGSQRRATCAGQLKMTVAGGTESFEAFTADLAREDGARVPLSELLAREGGQDRG